MSRDTVVVSHEPSERSEESARGEEEKSKKEAVGFDETSWMRWGRARSRKEDGSVGVHLHRLRLRLR